MKRLKKSLALLLSVIMIISALPLSALADEEYYDSDASGYCDDFYWTYTKETNTVYINATETNETGVVNAIDGNFSGCLPLYPTQEDYDADQNIFGLLTENCESAFEHIVIGKDITELNNVCFTEEIFPILKTVTFEEGSVLKKISTGMFNNSLITDIDIPDTVREIRDCAFTDSKLEKVKLPSCLEIIDEFAFAGCDSLGDVVIPANVTYIGTSAFYESGITTLSFEDDSAIQRILGDAFASCLSLKTVTIPANDIVFYDGIFESCENLETVVFEERTEDGKQIGVTNIGDYMFCGCINLRNVHFPSTLTSIQQYAFDSTFTKTEDNDVLEIDLSNTRLEKISSYAFECVEATNVYLPNSLKFLGTGAFEYSNCIKKIDLSKTSVTYIRNYTFQGCTALSEVLLSDDLTQIGSSAFASTASLKYLDFPVELKSIGSSAFIYSGIENVDLSYCYDGLSIGTRAFEYTTSLNSVSLPTENFSILQDYTFRGSSISEIEINSLTKIKQYAFYGCENLTKLEIPIGCTSIETYAIYNCPNLKELYVPYTVTSMGSPIVSWSNTNFITSLDILTYTGKLGGQYFGKAIENTTVYGMGGSLLQEYCMANNIAFVAVTDESIVDPSAAVYKGTWQGGTWTISRADGNHLSIKGSGDLTTECFKENGIETTFANLIDTNFITSIAFENGITSIPDHFAERTLNGTPDKTSVYFPSTLESIGDYAFYKRNLASISIPSCVTKIGEYAFAYNNFTGYNANSALKELGAYAFLGNPLTSVDLKNIEIIGEGAFKATKIQSLEFSDKIKSIGNSAFYGDTALTTVDLSKASQLKSISDMAFYGTGIKTIVIPNNIETIGRATFGNCKSLTSITISNYYANIFVDESNSANNAVGFDSHGDKLSTVICAPVGSSAQKYAEELDLSFKADFGDYKYCGKINQTSSAYANKPLNWYYDENKKILYVTGEGYFNQNILRDANGNEFTEKFDIDTIYVMKGVFQVTAELSVFNPKTVIFPEGMSTIGNRTLNNLPRLTEVKIPNSVNTMYADAFKGCTNLKHIEFGKYIPDNVCRGLTSLEFVDFGSATSIGRYAFEGCTKLQEIVIPDTITSIGQYAFNKCTSVQSVKIGNGVTKIEPFAFSKLPLCERVEINMASVPALSRNIFSQSGASTKGMEIILSDNVKSIDLGFFNELKLSKVILGNNVSSVSNTQLVPSLKSIEVPNDNSNYYSYNNCLYSSANILTFVPKYLDIVEIKEGTTAIGNNAFNGSNASTITIPNSVETIEANAFKNSKRLKNIRFNKGLVSIGEAAFEGCELLKTLNLPSTLESLGKYAFKDCSILASVILPNELKGIASNCFQNCRSLSGIVIPESVVSIGSDAFAGCSELKEFYIWNTKLGTNVFGKDNKINIYTMVGSPAYEYCRRWNIPYNAYTDEECFYDECAMKIDILAGYLGFCTDGHGDIQWLTVYLNDCDNDGYMIGVCEYCSEILEEKHLDAKGHNYVIKTEIAPTVFSRGMTVYECQNCNQRYTVYTDKNGSGEFVETHSVSGKVVIATDKNATGGVSPITNATIVIDGNTVATTNEKGLFSFELTTGLYEAEIRYAYGFTRTIFIRVENKDIEIKEPIAIIGCDFNKDGKIDNDDLTLFQYVVSAVRNDPSYLSFVDMNHDGYINAKDRAYIRECMGLDASTFDYPEIIVQK